MVAKDISLRFIVTSVILYLLAGVQGALMALLPLNRLTHFSDWVVGHSHLALARLRGIRGSRGDRSRVATHAGRSLFAPRHGLGLLARAIRPSLHGRGPDDRGADPGAPLEPRCAVDDIGRAVASVLGAPRGLRSDAGRCIRLLRLRPIRPGRSTASG